MTAEHRVHLRRSEITFAAAIDFVRAHVGLALAWVPGESIKLTAGDVVLVLNPERQLIVACGTRSLAAERDLKHEREGRPWDVLSVTVALAKWSGARRRDGRREPYEAIAVEADDAHAAEREADETQSDPPEQRVADADVVATDQREGEGEAPEPRSLRQGGPPPLRRAV